MNLKQYIQKNKKKNELEEGLFLDTGIDFRKNLNNYVYFLEIASILEKHGVLKARCNNTLEELDKVLKRK